MNGAIATTDDNTTKGEFGICCAFICLDAAMGGECSMIDGGGGEGAIATLRPPHVA